MLGLTEGAPISESWIEFDVGGVTFGIGNGEPLGMMPGTSFGVSFEVDDVQKERDRLAAAGVEIGDVNDAPTCFSAFAKDPEGNAFAIHQRK